MVEPLPTWARLVVVVVAVFGLAGAVALWWPGAEANGFVEVMIQRASSSNEGRELLLELDACANDGRVKVTASDSRQVRLLAEALDPSENESCGYSVGVRLDSPLADRVVVDDVTGEAVTVQTSP